MTRERLEETMHNHSKSGSGRQSGPLLRGLLLLVLTGSLVAVLVFHLSPLSVAIGALLLPTPASFWGRPPPQ